jgi:DNA-binding transcriptional regulator YhcF (GntR family)
LRDWLKRQVTIGPRGEKLATGSELARAFQLSEKSVRNVLKEFEARGDVLCVAGKGTFIGELPKPLEPPRTSEASIRNLILDAVARGDYKRGQPLPLVKQLSLQLGLAGSSVARAYRELAADGWCVRIGRRYVLGRHGVGVFEPSREVCLVSEHDADAPRDLGLGELTAAFAAMEIELEVCNARIVLVPESELRRETERWFRRRTQPSGLIFAPMTRERYPAALAALGPLLRRKLQKRPAILMAGRRRVEAVSEHVTFVTGGPQHTAMAREVAALCRAERYRDVRVLVDLESELPQSLRDSMRLLPEILRTDRGISLTFAVATSIYGDAAAVSSRAWSIGTLDELSHRLAKYERLDPAEIESRISLHATKTPAFFGSAPPSLFVCAHPATARATLDHCRRMAWRVPEQTSILVLAPNGYPEDLHIAACVTDFGALGYQMAHALLGDLPVQRSRRGFLRIPVRILKRGTIR